MQTTIITKILSSGKMLWGYLMSLLPMERKLCNLFFRPAIKLELKPKTIVFMVPNDNSEHHVTYLCLLITNESKNNYIVPLNSIKIGQNPCFNTSCCNHHYNDILKSKWETCSSEMLTCYRDNWLDITQGNYLIDAKPHIPMSFPLGDNINICSPTCKDSILFFNKKKIVVSLIINGKSYEYGLDRQRCYERYINHLQSRLHQFR